MSIRLKLSARFAARSKRLTSARIISNATQYVVEPLEGRRLLTTVTLTGSGSHNDFLVKLNPATNDVDFFVRPSGATTDTLLQSVPKSQVSDVHVLDSAGSGDTLRVDTETGFAISLDASGTAGLSLTMLKGDVNITSSQSLDEVSTGPGTLTMTANLYAESVQVDGQFRHLSGLLNTSTVEIGHWGSFADEGGSLANGIYINNTGTFKAGFVGSLANITGHFEDDGLFIEDVGAGNTNTIGMDFVNAGTTFDLVSGTVHILNPFNATSDLQIDGTNGTLRVTSYSTSTSTIVQTGGMFQVDSGLTVDDHEGNGAQYRIYGGTLTAGSLVINSLYDTTLVQGGGTITISGEADIGWYNQSGQWQMTGGTANFAKLNFGDWDAHTSTLDLTGGTINVSGEMDAGYGSPAIINISGESSLNAGSAQFGSWSGSCTVNQSSGTVVIGDLHLGSPIYGVGVYNLSGGLLDAGDEYLTKMADFPADIVYSTIHQTGGTNRTNWLDMGEAPGGKALYEMEGGTLVASWFIQGGAGADSAFVQTAGHTTIGQFLLGSSGEGTYTFDLSGGSVTVQNTAYVGYDAIGRVDQSGGTFNFDGQLYISGNGDDQSYPEGHGTYDLSGTGVVNVAGSVYVGYGSNGEINQSGGTISVGNYWIKNGPSGTVGTYTKTGGSLIDGNTGSPLTSDRIIDVIRPSDSGAALVDEGSPYTLDLSATTNIGTSAITGWNVNWDDTNVDHLSPAPSSAQHTYATGGVTRTIQASATDAHNHSFAADPLDVVVQDVPAIIAPVAAITIDAGQAASFSTTFTDPGTGETHLATIDWGDGHFDSSSDDGVTLSASQGGNSVTSHHQYNSHGTYTAILSVIDDGGALSELPITINVGYLAPSAAITVSSDPSNVLQTRTLKMVATGPEASGVTSWKVDWGDGTIDAKIGNITTMGDGSATWEATYTYTQDGTYTIHAWANDSAPTNHDAGTTSVTIAATPPATLPSGSSYYTVYWGGSNAVGDTVYPYNYSFHYSDSAISEYGGIKQADYTIATSTDEARRLSITGKFLTVTPRNGTPFDYYFTGNEQISGETVTVQTHGITINTVFHSAIASLSVQTYFVQTFQTGYPQYGYQLVTDTSPDLLIATDTSIANPTSTPGWAGAYTLPDRATPLASMPTPRPLSFINIPEQSEAKFRFVYNGSDTSNVVKTGSGTSSDPYLYSRSDNGTFRIWRTNYNGQPHALAYLNGLPVQNGQPYATGGDYIVPGVPYSESTIGTYFIIEPIVASKTLNDRSITIEEDPDGNGPLGFILSKRITFTAVNLQVDVQDDFPELTWTPLKGTNVTLYRNSTVKIADPIDGTVGNYIDDAILQSQYYSYVIMMTVGNDPATAVSVTGDEPAYLPPYPVADLTASMDESGAVTLTWKRDSRQTYYTSQYEIYRAKDLSDDDSFQLIGQKADGNGTITFTDQDINPNSQYSYFIKAIGPTLYGAGGGSTDSEETVIVKTQASSQPSVPTQVHAASDAVEGNIVTWLPVSGATYLKLERAQSPSATSGDVSEFSTIAILSPMAMAYMDKQILHDITYKYRVTACNSAGQAVSDVSNSAIGAAAFNFTGTIPVPVFGEEEVLDNITTLARYDDKEAKVLITKLGLRKYLNLEVAQGLVKSFGYQNQIDVSSSGDGTHAEFHVYNNSRFSTLPTYIGSFRFVIADTNDLNSKFYAAKLAADNGIINGAAGAINTTVNVGGQTVLAVIPGPDDILIGKLIEKAAVKLLPLGVKATWGVANGVKKWVFRSPAGAALAKDAEAEAVYALREIMRHDIAAAGSEIDRTVYRWNPRAKHVPMKAVTDAEWNILVENSGKKGTKYLNIKGGNGVYKTGQDIEMLERQAWANGTDVASGRSWKIFDAGKIIGAADGAETQYMRIELASDEIHGFPISLAKYNSYK